LGVVYLFAFASLYPQIPGLIGQNGILPAGQFLDAVRASYGAEAYRLLPTLAWINASDPFLQLLCVGGIVLSALLIWGILSVPVLAFLWILYLSLTVAGQVFMGFQWDALLLETGFLAIFFAPFGIRTTPAREAEPSPILLWLFRWLLFRLMFGSAVVKLASGDPAWHDLIALSYHFETQPIPTPLGWYAHQLPLELHILSAVGVFVIEGFLPFLIFIPLRKLRYVAAGGFTLLQGLIALTGNYAYFNLLTITLCLLLLDDSVVRRFLPRSLVPLMREERIHVTRPQWRQTAEIALAAFLVFLSGIQVASLFISYRSLPTPVLQIAQWVTPFNLVNRYGLFAVMTTSRPEIIVEGSNDEETWLAYEFPYKAGDVMRAPPFVAPYQPRLDWQMWFAALGTANENPWFGNFILRLAQGSPEVLALLAHNPFPDAPPRFLRAVVYDYHFTDFATRSTSGAWWQREYIGNYFPTSTPDR
jgi:hypothetical protein